MDSDDEYVRPPVPSYNDTLLPNNNIPDNDDSEFNSIIKQSLLEYEEQLKKNRDEDIEKILQQSLKEYEEQLKKNEELQNNSIITNINQNYETNINQNYENTINQNYETNINQNYETNIDKNILKESLIEYEKNIQNCETAVLNNTYLDFINTQYELKKSYIEKLNPFISQLKRINSLQKNEILENLLIALESYVNNNINEITFHKDVYKKTFNEIKNIRHTSEIFEILQIIIHSNNDIEV